MARIIQSSQYALPVQLYDDNAIYSPANVDGIRIQLDTILDSWPNGNITYDYDNNYWLFPLNRADTIKLTVSDTYDRTEKKLIQAEVKIDDCIIPTDAVYIDVGRNIIEEDWD